jgi:hypothetical protein
VLDHDALQLDVVQSSQLKFPVSDFVLRAAALARFIEPDKLSTYYLRSTTLERIRTAVGVPIPGYRWVEATGRKVT